MSEHPSFVLSGPAGTLVATGVTTEYDDVAAAAAALREGSAGLVVGALPFDIREPAALLQPVSVSDSLPPQPTAGLPTVRITGMLPDPDTHRGRIDAALRLLRDAENPLEKVVLARALQLDADAPMDPFVILRRLIAADPDACAYLADLSPAGPAFAGTALVGASPELLVARRGEVVSAQPFAGSAPRSADPDTDAANAAALAGSEKNRHEHQLVVDTMRAALEPLFARIDTTTLEARCRAEGAALGTLQQHDSDQAKADNDIEGQQNADQHGGP